MMSGLKKPVGKSSRAPVLHIVAKVWVLLIRQVLESVFVRNLLVTRLGQVTAGLVDGQVGMCKPFGPVSADE